MDYLVKNINSILLDSISFPFVLNVIVIEYVVALHEEKKIKVTTAYNFRSVCACIFNNIIYSHDNDSMKLTSASVTDCDSISYLSNYMYVSNFQNKIRIYRCYANVMYIYDEKCIKLDKVIFKEIINGARRFHFFVTDKIYVSNDDTIIVFNLNGKLMDSIIVTRLMGIKIFNDATKFYEIIFRNKLLEISYDMIVQKKHAYKTGVSCIWDFHIIDDYFYIFYGKLIDIYDSEDKFIKCIYSYIKCTNELYCSLIDNNMLYYWYDNDSGSFCDVYEIVRKNTRKILME